MKLAISVGACLLIFASVAALAIDPSDEDASYLPQDILDSLIAPRYGVDVATQSRCIAANRANAKSESASKTLSTTCRVKATPKKCRELSAIPPEKVSMSAQEICANACKRDKFRGDCALN